MNSPGGGSKVESERTPDSFFDSAARRIDVQTHLTAEKEIGIEISEHEVRVGHRWLAAAQAVAGWSGVRACALWPDLEQAHVVDPRDRPSPRTDFDQFDRGRQQREPRTFLETGRASDLELKRDERFATVDDARLGRGATHVEGKQAMLLDEAGETRRRDDAGGRARLD